MPGRSGQLNRLVFVLLLLLCGSTRVPAQQPTPAPPIVAGAAIDSLFAPFARIDGPGCAVGVYRAGEILFAKGYGMASVEHAAPITPRTPFVVASVTKHFTAFAVHLLARRGSLSLDDDIRRHLPEVPALGATVTVRHLLHHTSGLRAYEDLLSLTGWNRDHPLSREQVLATVLAHRTLGFPPGERFQYANTNYVLLAEIVERVSGRSFAEFMAQEVFAPLGMANTHVRTDPLAVIAGRAEHYWPDREGDGFRRNFIWAFPYATGASNLVTTLEDLARWDANFYEERVGGPGITRAMYARGVLASGDSMGGLVGHRGLPAYMQGGGGGGDYSIIRFPGQRLTTAVLCNLGSGAGAQDRALRVAEYFLGAALAPVPAPEASTVKLTEGALRRFIGEYRHPAIREHRVRIDVRDGTLGYAEPGGAFRPAVPVGPRTFRDGPLTFEFSEPVTGVPTRITYEVSGQSGILIEWLEPSWQPDAADLAAFAGRYRSEEIDMIWSVALHGDSLVLSRPRLPDRVLAPRERDGFRWEESFEDEALEIDLTFTRAPDGRVHGLRVETQRVSNLEFTRVVDRQDAIR